MPSDNVEDCSVGIGHGVLTKLHDFVLWMVGFVTTHGHHFALAVAMMLAGLALTGCCQCCVSFVTEMADFLWKKCCTLEMFRHCKYSELPLSRRNIC